MIWFTSDNHFGHGNILNMCRSFPDVHEMNKTMTDNWNATVQPHDIVYHLGDFAWKKKYHVFEDKLGGKIFHIRGNHDREKWPTYSMLEINDLVIWLQHRPPITQLEISPEADLVICGHVHERWQHQMLEYPDLHNPIPIINVSVEAWKYKPVSIDQIINLYNEIINKNETT
jgi:calcineurin-like phosphoesterase family protein